MGYGKIITGILISILICCHPYIGSRDDISILNRIVEAEATDGTYEQKMNVAYCVISRVKSKGFPDTVEGVVFQKGQFTPISDKRYYSVKVSSDTEKAVLEALLTFTEGHGCTYFCTDDCSSYKNGFHSRLKEVFYDGVHHYFKG